MAGARSTFSPTLDPMASARHPVAWTRARPVRRSDETAYDAFVRWMRRILPLAALLVVLVIIFLPSLQSGEVSFTLSQTDVATVGDQIRMVKPNYRGTDSLGRFFEISADSGVQVSPDDPRIELTGITAQMELDEATEARMWSESGSYIPDDDTLRLDGDVLIETTDGNRFTAQQAAFDMTTKIARSDASVVGVGPLGTFIAQNFEIHVDEALAIFEGGVRMRVDPTGRVRIRPEEIAGPR